MKLFNWLESSPTEAIEDGAEPPLAPALRGRLKELEQISVKDAMIPRPLVTALDADVQLRRVKRLKSAKVAYFPVFRGDLDHILGWIAKPRVLELLNVPSEDVTLSDHVAAVGVVPESATLAQLPDAFLRAGSPFLVVHNEHGLTTGIFTLTEMVEQIFGFELEAPAPTGGADISLLRGYEL